eukprot:CAMPEP_0202337376 /NCGR_PEP_ID=MMETSP1126-20121109/82_1 /ASSEMBLY_ACC=CAM_ASM_000457 /TAXON_ID=3047 /ORGANISM="Dunaliella tertiolecta, Strain CCMP1320" /LENGTH=215 /DNA_ID=CAMNT_0048927553 /DNA_START=1225 /DNA_END=1872 /DNA_ORIENTATION=+
MPVSKPSKLNSPQMLQPISASSLPDAPGPQREKERVSVVYRGLELEARRGARLRTALLKAGVSPHNGDAKLINCRGLGTCGTCAVQISGTVFPAELTSAEKLRLNFPPHRPPNNQRLRLACQVKLQGDVNVVKYDQFWGQGSLPLGPLRQQPTDVARQQPVSSLEAPNRFKSTEGDDEKEMESGKIAEEPKSRLGLSCMPLGGLEFFLDSESGVK